MNGEPVERRLGYALAAAAVAVAAVARWGLAPLLDWHSPLLVFVMAVLVAARIGGLWPGLLATALSLIVARLSFMPPPGEPQDLWQLAGADQVAVGLFLMIGTAVSIASEQRNRALRSAQAERRRLREEAARRERSDRERAGTAARLRESEERLRLIADHAPVLIAYCDSRRRYGFVNQAYADRFGLHPVDIEGRFVPDVVGDEVYQLIRPYMDTALGGTPVAYEVEVPYHGLGRQHLHCAYAPEKDAAGRVMGYVSAITNITERKRAEQRKDEFLATLAHELRNPLAPIRNAVQLLHLAGEDRRVSTQALAMMERQVAQMVRLIDDLLDLSRITRNRLELKKAWVELELVVRHAIETSRPLIDAAGHELSVSLPTSPVLLDADLTRLAQVLSNLLNNAAKYTEGGGRIAVTAVLRRDEVAISVTDSGIGIAAPMLPLVFDMFTQVQGSLDRSQGGLGIGLTLVKRLVELHGGCVEAYSAGPGRGSQFVVRLPVVQVAAARGHAPATPAPLPGPCARLAILVVDDNRDAADSLTHMLRLFGHDVRVAYDGADALEASADGPPDLVFLDIGMPQLDGYDTARRMREQWGSRPRLVAVTGWGQDEDKRRAADAGFDCHLTKPVEPAAVLGLVAELAPLAPAPADSR